MDPTPYELKVVSNLAEVDPDFLRSALDDEERSHTDIEDDSVMVLTNVAVCRGQDSYDALPLAIIITEEYIITVCLEETPVMAEFNERTAKLFRTYKKQDFCFRFCINLQRFTCGICARSASFRMKSRISFAMI